MILEKSHILLIEGRLELPKPCPCPRLFASSAGSNISHATLDDLSRTPGCSRFDLWMAAVNS